MTIETITIRGGNFEVCECGLCGVVYTVPSVIRTNHREHGGYSCCPNGHRWGWAAEDSTDAKIKRERDRLAQKVAEQNDEIDRHRSARAEAERRELVAKGQLTKLKKRAAAGVCPCCNRTFSALSNHIATKHPQFRAEDVTREIVVSLVKSKAK